MFSSPPSMPVLGILAKHGTSYAAKKVCEFLAPHLRARKIPRQDMGPYLVRHYFDSVSEAPGRQDSEIGVFLHKFVGDDDPGIVHSHPWVWCASIILAGSYKETRYKWSTETLRLATPTLSSPKIERVKLHSKTTKVLAPFDVNIINHDDMHHVALIDKECWTLFVHGPRVSTWGFADETSGKFAEVVNGVRPKTEREATR